MLRQATAVLLLLATGCVRPLPVLAPQMLPEPEAADIERVIYIAGDAGYALEAHSPLLRRLREDVEDWSTRLPGDTAVVMLFMGDNVYPDGMDSVSEPAYARDSTVLQGQVNVVAGPNARRRALGIFVAGNHDWANERGGSGVRRLQVQEAFLERRRARGERVHLAPEAGEPGPALLDIGSRLRILFYDTAWWMLATDKSRKARVYQQTEDMLRSAGDRVVIIAEHHPFKSASTHGGNVSFWKGLGVRFLLSRSGAVLQDLNSLPFLEFKRMMEEAFSIRQPLVFAGGHDHALQVIEHDGPNAPRYTLVSGSGSNVDPIGHTTGMQYRQSAPGYMKLFLRRDGHVDLFVVAAPDEGAQECSGDGTALAQCMSEKTASFATRFGKRLR